LSSLGDDKLVLFGILFSLLLVSNFCFLRSEISYEPQYLEMSAPLGENFIYNISIKNIGSDNVNLSCSTEGFNHIAINFTPPNILIKQGTKNPIIININTTGALPGDYRGLYYIWKDSTDEVLEMIPITIQVKNSSQKFNQSS